MNSLLEEKVNGIWLQVSRELGLDEGDLMFDSAHPGRRVYHKNGIVYKISLKEYDVSRKLRNYGISGEYEILKECKGVNGIPEVISFESRSNYELLTMRRVNGSTLGEINFTQLLFVASKLSIILARLSFKGISHNDIKYENILFSRKDNQISLVDFDQAAKGSWFSSLTRSFLGISIHKPMVHGSLFNLFKCYLKDKYKLKLIKRLRDKIIGKGKDRLPELDDNSTVDKKMLLEAWKIAQASRASSPGSNVAYYSLNYDGVIFPGERPWEARWSMLQGVTDFAGKNVLELGCNMSLLSCFLLKEKHVRHALAVDMDENILESAQIIAKVFGVSPVYVKKNLDSSEQWEDQLVNPVPDIVFALNVLNWVKDKDRLLNFLGRFNEVVFEGHDSDEREIERFKNRGFENVDVIGVSERNRTLFRFYK